MFGMPSCQEAARLVSQSMEQKLPLIKRLGLWMHLSMCRMCKGFAGQLRLLQTAAKQHGESQSDTSLTRTTLPSEARQRIHHALEKAQSNGE